MNIRDLLDPRNWSDLDEPRQLWLDVDAGVFCLLDPIDYDWAIQWRWGITQSKGCDKLYATRSARQPDGKVVKLYLHKEVLRRVAPQISPAHRIADHLDGNSLNDRRGNFRWATPQMNRANWHGEILSQGNLFGVAA